MSARLIRLHFIMFYFIRTQKGSESHPMTESFSKQNRTNMEIGCQRKEAHLFPIWYDNPPAQSVEKPNSYTRPLWLLSIEGTLKTIEMVHIDFKQSKHAFHLPNSQQTSFHHSNRVSSGYGSWVRRVERNRFFSFHFDKKYAFQMHTFCSAH